jgi:cobalt/nickel transport protein
MSAVALVMLFTAVGAFAHFQYLLPSDDMVMQGENRTITLDLIFGHPFEGEYMEMAKPLRFGVRVRGRDENLLKPLKPMKKGGFSAWRSSFTIRRPGDYVFYVEPAPYFEPAEESFIVHYTKVVVHALGLEEGWDEEIGLKTEIIPLTRPYGLWTGNVFQGIVKAFGEPVPYAEVEVEYLAEGRIDPPADPFVTQVIRADGNGVFTYACPKAGWWAFAALSEDRVKMKYSDGKSYPVEIGALFWIRGYDME